MGFRALAPYVWPIYGPWMSASLALAAAFGEENRGNMCINGLSVSEGNVPAWIADRVLPKFLKLFGSHLAIGVEVSWMNIIRVRFRTKLACLVVAGRKCHSDE